MRKEKSGYYDDCECCEERKDTMDFEIDSYTRGQAICQDCYDSLLPEHKTCQQCKGERNYFELEEFGGICSACNDESEG